MPGHIRGSEVTTVDWLNLLKSNPSLLSDILANRNKIAMNQHTAEPAVPEAEAGTADAAPPPAEEFSSSSRKVRAAGPAAPSEEEVVTAAADAQPSGAPAAPPPFKIVSTCCSTDFITLDASTSGSVDLGTGRDAVAFPGNRVDYKVARQDGGWAVSHDVDGAKVTINLRGVEWLQFDDGVACLDINDTNAITGYQIVKAVLGVPRDLNRVFSVAADLDNGQYDNIIGDLMNWMTRERMSSSFALGPEEAPAAVREVGQGAPLEPAL